MNSKRTMKWKIFLVPLLTIIFGIAADGCSDDNNELENNQYGYVQFKLYKSASYVQEGKTESSSTTTRAATDVDKLSEIQKVEVEMQCNEVSITQTLKLNAYNESNAEYGMRSDKLKLLVGNYKIIGYKLFNKLDEQVTGVSTDAVFTVVANGLTVQDLSADVQARGTVTFKLTKEMVNTRAAESYRFNDIKIVDVTVTNTFTRIPITIEGLKVTQKEESEENPNPDNADDKYKDIETASCDSAVWLPAGTYQVTSYKSYSKVGAVKKILEVQTVKGDEFTVSDNILTKGAIIPVLLSETAPYIKDYLALKEIWEALDGKNWGYHGIGTPEGTNWNFNKELDMWGNQPGVSLNSEGRVIGLSLEGFGAKGRVPDVIGQLTKLRILALGSHSEQVSGKLFTDENMKESQIEKVRINYKNIFLDYDPRLDLSELIRENINRDPQQKKIEKNNRITLKDTQIGNLTNGITFVSKAIMFLTELQQFYMGNSPFTYDNICTEWENKDSKFAKENANKYVSWASMRKLTDIELYNCPNLVQLPAFLTQLPELQVLNIACNRGIDSEQLTKDWKALADSRTVGPKLQILYMSYNKLEEFPPTASLKKMKKLVLLDCMSNNLKTVNAFTSDIKLTQLNLNNNKITKIPEDFCGFTDQVEGLNFSHNELKYIPNIFNAKSVYVMGSVNFSYNKIGSDTEGKNFEKPDEFKGINASTISLGYNQIKNFPKELFKANSPITTIDLSGNLMKEIPEYSLKGKDGTTFTKTHLLTSIDLRFNQLTKLSDDFRATTLPYLRNMDVSFNCFSKFPTEPLNCSELQAFGIRHQRDAEGNRCLRDWPTGITKCPSLIQLQIGSNDIRKVDETMTSKLWILDIKDNPNISIDLTSVCPYIKANMYMLIYDKTQDIRGCDVLDIKR